MTFLDAPGNPDIQPSGGPGGIPRIVVRPNQGTSDAGPGAGGDPYAGAVPYAPPPAPGTPGGSADPYAGAAAYEPPPPKARERQTGAGEAAVMGAVDTATMGLGPALAGSIQAVAAKGEKTAPTLPEATTPEGEEANAGARSLAGVYGIVHDLFTGHPDPDVRRVYDKGRQDALADNELLQKQHAAAYTAGQLTGILAGGASGAGRGAATVLGRVAGAAKTGGIQGGLYGAGKSTSEGNTPGQVIKDAGSGALTGAVLGGVGGGAVESVGELGSKIMSTVRGKTNPTREVAARVGSSLVVDADRAGGIPFTPEELRAANRAGTPIHVLDIGGEQTRGLAQSAAFASRGAKQALEDVINPRAASQGYRVGQRLRTLRGRPYADLDTEALKGMSRRANAGVYKTAYTAGDRVLWSRKLAELSSAPAVEAAIERAGKTWKNYAVADGLAAMNIKYAPNVVGDMSRTGGKGIANPEANLQFWDYVHRELSGAADKAKGALGSSTTESSNLSHLDSMLKDELDRLVPEYGTARGVAHAGFVSREAHELGQELVTSTAPAREVQRMLAKLSPFDREVVARGFTADMATKLENLSRSGDVGSMMSAIKQAFVSSIPARQRIRVVLGDSGADEFEALLRAEGIIQKSRQILQGSDTARKLSEGAVAGGAVASVEALKEGEIDPYKFAAFMIGGGLAHRGIMKAAERVDEDVARRVGEMLASPDPQVVLRGMAYMAKNTYVFDAFRRLSDGIAAVSTRDIGPRPATAAVLTAVEKLLSEGDDDHHHSRNDSLYDSVTQ